MTAHPITELRAGRSVEWLARTSGVPATTIARMEAGLTRRPFASNVLAIAKALEADANELEIQIVRYRQAQESAQAQAAEVAPS